MKFHEWLNEIEVFSTREERFIDAINNCNDLYYTLLSWLYAAYQVGYDHALNNLIDDGK